MQSTSSIRRRRLRCLCRRSPLRITFCSNPAINPAFTSGSTGVPKGVMLSHLNALTFVNWGCETFGITANDRLSNHAPFNFDLSGFNIFVVVKAGAAISLVPEGLAVFRYNCLLSFRTKRSRSGIPSRSCWRSCRSAGDSKSAISPPFDDRMLGIAKENLTKSFSVIGLCERFNWRHSQPPQRTDIEDCCDERPVEDIPRFRVAPSSIFGATDGAVGAK